MGVICREAANIQATTLEELVLKARLAEHDISLLILGSIAEDLLDIHSAASGNGRPPIAVSILCAEPDKWAGSDTKGPLRPSIPEGPFYLASATVP